MIDFEKINKTYSGDNYRYMIRQKDKERYHEKKAKIIEQLKKFSLSKLVDISQKYLKNKN